jgi:hypothetical protein
MKRSRIQEVVDLWLKKKVFTLNGIKRSLQATVRDLNLTEEGVEMVGMSKPDGTDVLGMFNAGPEVFQCGADELPIGSHHLNVRNMVGMHVE